MFGKVALFSLPLAIIVVKPPLVRHPDADEIFAERKALPLTPEERQITGKWAAENREVAWEISRAADGTFEIVVVSEYDDFTYTDYYRGTWGIDGETYYYHDLEAGDPEMVFEDEPSMEKVLEIGPNRFLTEMSGDDGEPLLSDEHRVKRFHNPLWKRYGSPEARAPGDS